MTSRIIPADKPEEKKWPRLMIHEREGISKIVLFTSIKEGFVLSSTVQGECIGYYYRDWNEDAFKPFHGTVELSND